MQDDTSEQMDTNPTRGSFWGTGGDSSVTKDEIGAEQKGHPVTSDVSDLPAKTRENDQTVVAEAEVPVTTEYSGDESRVSDVQKSPRAGSKGSSSCRGNHQIVRRRHSTKAISKYNPNRGLKRRPIAKASSAANDSPRPAKQAKTPKLETEAETSQGVMETTRAVAETATKVVAEAASVAVDKAADVFSNVPDIARDVVDMASDMAPKENPLKDVGKHLKDAKVRERIAGLTRKQVIGLVCLVLFVIYGVGAIWFSGHFSSHANVNGNDVSLMSKKRFSEHAQQYANDYTLKVQGDGVDLTIGADDIALSYDVDAFVDAAFSHVSGWLWPIDLFLPHDWEVTDGITLDEAKLKQAVSNAVATTNSTATFPRNASISYDAKAKSFTGVQQQYGNAVSDESATQKAFYAASTLRREATLDESDILQPEVTIDDSRFDDILKDANTRATLKLDLQIDGKRIAIIDPSLLADWMTFDESGAITGDIEKISEWTRGEFSSKIDTVGTTRTYTRPDGKEVTISDGTYGWCVDGSELASLIAEHIKKNWADPIEVPFKSKGKVLAKGTPDWGNRFVDVDLSEQYVRMYDDDGNTILESYCVTGDQSNNNDTVTGVYYIEDKQSPMTLVGLDEDGDGEPDYENDVDYWMPFYGGYGLHDATWRGTFGGDVFQYGGSHGCVNLPYDTAQSLYYFVEKGDPVVVHW